jgi:ferrochelatase
LISTTRAPSAKLNYAIMGGGSPLLPETQAQSTALLARLSAQDPDTDFKIFIAMRYWKPFTEVTAREVAAFCPDDVVLLPLYPHFSTTTTGSSVKAWNKAYRGPGQVHTVCCYPSADGFIEAHAERILECWKAAGSPTNVRLLFSAHGLPEKVIKDGDPYQSQIEATAAAVAARLGDGWDWQVCYQSRVGPLKWIGPSTTDAISSAAAEGKGVLMTPIAFGAFGHTGIVFWVAAAMCVPAALMVMNPIHVAGTLIIGSSAVENQDAVFRRLLALACCLALIIPGLLALIPIALS